MNIIRFQQFRRTGLALGAYYENWAAVAVDSYREQGGYKFTVK